MDWIRPLRIVLLAMVALLPVSCSINYKFTGTSINYDVTKTIQFSDFPIRSAYVWMPMHSMFNNELQDTYARQTKLRQVK